MARTLISENEKFEILNKHNNFKKILENELKHLNRGLVSEQTLPTGQVSDPLLAAASKAGCINNGSITMFEGKPVYMKKAKKDLSPKFAIGDTLVLYNDYSYWVFPQAGTSRKGPYKWSCPEINASMEQQNKTSLDKTKLEGNWKTKEELLKTDTEQNIVNPVMYETTTLNGVTLYRRKSSSSIGSALTDDQQKIVNKWTAQGAKLRKDLDAEEAKTWQSRVVSPASEGYFSQDLVMYFHPKQTIDKNVSTTIQTSVEANIPTDKKDCKTNIENYYTNFKKKRVIEPNQLEALKYKVQACKNEFYGDWGFLGGRKIDNYLDILSGDKEGGPLSDSKWRIE